MERAPFLGTRGPTGPACDPRHPLAATSPISGRREMYEATCRQAVVRRPDDLTVNGVVVCAEMLTRFGVCLFFGKWRNWSPQDGWVDDMMHFRAASSEMVVEGTSCPGAMRRRRPERGG